MKTAPTPASQTRRFGAAGLALVFAAMHFGAALHMATVEHETCPHGEFVHRDAHTESDGNAPALGAFASVRGLDLAAEDHDHCSTNFRHEEFDLVLASVDTATKPIARDALEQVAVARRIHVAQADLYRLAPKTSPPRV